MVEIDGVVEAVEGVGPGCLVEAFDVGVVFVVVDGGAEEGVGFVVGDY